MWVTYKEHFHKKRENLQWNINVLVKDQVIL